MILDGVVVVGAGHSGWVPRRVQSQNYSSPPFNNKSPHSSAERRAFDRSRSIALPALLLTCNISSLYNTMSTLATADLGPSDDEGDTDFVLPAPKAKRSKKRGAHGVKRVRSGSQSASDGESSGSSDQDGDDDADDDGDDEVKRLRAEHAEAQAEERKRRAADAFKAMQEEARAPVKAAGEVKAAAAEVEMVEVKRPRRFAGETI